MRADKNQMTADHILAVDLDGTLLRSDMLFESFWSGFAGNWRVPVLAFRAMQSGKANLKRVLAERASVDVATLPYEQSVLDYIADWKAKGGRVALVTATDEGLAQAIAGHLGIFDAVHASDGMTNLKGEAKAELLERVYGRRGFAYMGNDDSDLAIWRRAARAISVNAPASLRTQVDGLGVPAEHIDGAGVDAMAYLRAMRPHQWMKNLLVFVPMFTAHQVGATTALLSLLAFISFSLIASSVYVLNDLLDLAADRAHPRKRNRPFAAGAIPIAKGSLLAPVLFAGGFVVAAILGVQFLTLMLLYFGLTTAYSLYLKRRLVIDIIVLATLYTIRVVAGGAATGLPISVWLLAFSMFFFLALAAVKRQAELVDGIASGKVTAHGRGYHVDDLPLVESMATSAGYVAVLVMALYANSPTVQTLYRSPEMLWGVCLVLLYWLSRMVMITHRGRMHDDPVVFAVKDNVSRSCLVMIVALAVAGAVM